MDKEQLKLHISSIQSEIDRIQALLSDYIGDIIAVNKDRNAQSHMEAVWKLADDLTTTFQLSNPATYELFKYLKEINELSSLLNNDNDKKKRKKINVTDDDSSNKTINNEINSPPTKRIHRATSKNAKEILFQLLAHTTFYDDDQLLYDVLHELQDIESGWTKERAMIYWRNHHNKNKQNM
ncbi:hypothetical protein F8M41_009393 [Gigaspora margarita]|uniref:Uncharacterized protein n=1 Tax=Gigaspora margarita TaxID=4874 RepID=A0A8H3X441_GIGMA|nr:hypothetical protein F8M41_009393 [Gigaspora margarita]